MADVGLEAVVHVEVALQVLGALEPLRAQAALVRLLEDDWILNVPNIGQRISEDNGVLTFSLRHLCAENLKEQICAIYIMTPHEVVTYQSWREASVGFNIPLYIHALLILIY